MDLAIDAVLRTCTRKTLFCYGNGNFKTGLNLASVHESFKGKFTQKQHAMAKYANFDDADILDMGCEPAICQIMEGYNMPKDEELRTAFFGADFPSSAQFYCGQVQQYCRNPSYCSSSEHVRGWRATQE
ncbi:hypothetical protein K457DRAFT_129043 [Linnemannia elongata AG-77]|uniref:Uncharacterized protein n=1 Tax=Linnemannia elongata AG-77 TaxID=1314771 RepID=A0A197JJW4_9FUNG|nr:hypothetical protein K457DRAFT_129043 [Linnemannia elongata AG-77]